MNKKRWLLIGGIVVVVAPVVGVSIAGGSILRAAVEKGAAWALDVPVSVGGGSLGLLSGSVGLSSMTIGNPPGFKTEKSFSVGDVRVSARPLSLMSDTVVVNEIVVDQPELTLEVSGTGGTNLGALMDNVDRKVGSAGKPSGEKPKEEGAASKNLVVKEVRITKASFRLSIAGAGAAIPIPDITLHDVGTGPSKDQTNFPQLVKQILAEIGSRAAQSGAGQIPQQIAESLKRESANALAEIKKSTQILDASLKRSLEGGNVGEELEKGAASMKKSIEGAGKDLEGILKPNKKK